MIRKSTKLIGQLAIPLLALTLVLPCGAASSSATAAINTLYTFNNLGDGGYPESGLVRTSGGVLYGTTYLGGASGWGTVFELVPNTGGKTYTQYVLYSFTGLADGANPVSDLVIGNSGILYGTTYGGGAHGYGTVFELLPASKVGEPWTEKVLYSFQGGTADGAYPAAGVTWRSASGVLYGTTYGGGTGGFGTVFELVPNANTGTWTETVLYNFQSGTDGAYPLTDLVLANSSTITIYGTTSQGGSITIPAGTAPVGTNPGCAANPYNAPCTYENWGTVFQLVGSGGGKFTETLLYTFFGAADGGSPESALIMGTGGVFYGSTFWGGTPTSCATGDYPQGCGVVYELTPPTSGSGPYTETALHTFTNSLPDGEHPYRNMTMGSTGILYGTTYAGGQNVDTCFPAEAFVGCGTIFDLTPPSAPGGTWKKANLIALDGQNGGGPNGVILGGAAGTLYGTTEYGGPGESYGIVYEWVQ